MPGLSFVAGTMWDMFRNYTGVGQSYTRVQDKLRAPIVNSLNNIIPYAGEVFAAADDVVIKTILS